MKWFSRIRLPSTVFPSAVFLVLLASLAGEPADAGYYDIHHVAGLWEGVDTLDGSTVRVSIGNFESDDSLEFRWHESFFTGCFNQGFSSGRGLIAGTVHRSRANHIELVVTRYLCFDDDNNEVDIGPFTVELRYSLKDDVLVRTTQEGFPGFILHRISSNGGR